ncbi:ABC transporter ATP-binding protein [Sedimenticola hydrogenitrophicus]|uniref:ABC transporter ATP-binding protein n=1 Tax=Sedimenticola hydrogenitrophicus TaxID=2967975 RepID=UPI0021A96C77|nr:ABC transporter ATP-binding protein [Sedimenticola hydrogenitrophicus]
MKQQLGIEIERLRKVYPRKISDQLASVVMAALGRPRESTGGGTALSGLTLSIREGERVGIIGRNGAGKSTLLQMLAGITEPTSGHLRISGKVTAVLTLGIGLREDLTGRENIYLDGETQGKERVDMDADVDAIIDFAELGKFIDLPLRTYSTGMKARLAFAMITQIDPEILIIDEALSVGDAAFSIKAGRRIAQLCAQGAIVLIVSHSMQSIRELCNRCLWLDQGKLVMDGLTDDVTRAYLESVREADEADHMARFRSLIGTQSLLSGFFLSELRITSGDQEVMRLVSGSPLSITCDWQQPEGGGGGGFFLRCTRLDDALICEHSVNVADGLSEGSLRMTYPHFHLAPGLYRLHLEWQDTAGRRRAESATILEVVAEDVPTGGRPVLLGIGQIESIKVSEEAGCR